MLTLNHKALHESLEMHELLTFKNNCLTKTSAMVGLANDQELKAILSTSAKQSRQEIEQLLECLSGEAFS